MNEKSKELFDRSFTDLCICQKTDYEYLTDRIIKDIIYDSENCYTYYVPTTDSMRLVLKEDQQYLDYKLESISRIYGKDIKRIRFFNSICFKYLNAAFYGCVNLETVHFVDCDFKDITNFNSMFIGCDSLKSVNFCSCNNIKPASMASMFFNCSELENIDFRSFDFSEVQFMDGIFKGCNKLHTIYINENTGVTNDSFSKSEKYDEIRELLGIDYRRLDFKY